MGSGHTGHRAAQQRLALWKGFGLWSQTGRDLNPRALQPHLRHEEHNANGTGWVVGKKARSPLPRPWQAEGAA